MTNGWCPIDVDHLVALVPTEPDVDPDQRPDHDGSLVVKPRPSETLKLRVDFTNNTEHAKQARVRLVGLGQPIFAYSDQDVPANTPAPVRREFTFPIPPRLRPGRTAAALEWMPREKGPPLAIGDLAVEVDDVSKVTIDLVDKRLSGMLSDGTDVVLGNTGSEPVLVSLGAFAADNKRKKNKEPVRVDFRPDTVRLAPGQQCNAYVTVQHKAQWFRRDREHVFDVIARGASGEVSTTGSFRQKAVFPPLLFKIIAYALLVVLFVWALVSLVRFIVDDGGGPATWAKLPDAPDATAARSGHTATWMTYERPDRTGLVGELQDAWDGVLGRDSLERAVLVWGGEDTSGSLLSDGAIYSSTGDSWRTITPLQGPEARVGHEAVWTGEHLVVWGGYTPDNVEEPEKARESQFYGAAYDPVTDRWTNLPPSRLTPRVGHSVIWTGSELIVFGGVAPDGTLLGDGGILRAAELTSDGEPTAERLGDLTDGVWSLFRVDDLGTFQTAPRAYHAATFDGTYMVVSGGIGPNAAGELLLNDTYAYDVGRNRWHLVRNNTFERRACHQAVVDGGEVVFLGGLSVRDIDVVDAPSNLVGPPFPLGSEGQIGLRSTFCNRPRLLENRDPAAWKLALAPNDDDPAVPTFEWTALTDAPMFLGSNFVATSTNDGIAIAYSVRSLNSVAPLVYRPDDPAAIEMLTSAEQLRYRSQLVAAWDEKRLVVWGGRELDGCEPDRVGEAGRVLLPDQTCPRKDGARIDVSS